MDDDLSGIMTVLNQVDTLILVGAKMPSSFIEKLAGHEVQVILIDNFHEMVHSVCIDYSNCIYRATELLYNMGHREIAFIGANKSMFSHSLKYEGYKRAVNDFKLVEMVEYYNGGNYYYEGMNMITRLLERKCKFTSIISTGEMMTIGAANMLIQSGFLIPRDISIIGLGDSNMLDNFNPPITSISLMSEQMSLCALHLYRVIHRDIIANPIRMYVTPVLNKRASCLAIKNEMGGRKCIKLGM